MDRTGWFFVILSAIGLVAFWAYDQKVESQYRALHPVPIAAASASPTPDASTPAAASVSQAASPSSLTVMTASSASLFVENEAEYVFDNDAGGIQQVTLYKHKAENGESVILNRDRSLPIGALGFQAGEVTGGFDMHTDASKGVAVFNKKQDDGLMITKQFTLPPSGSKDQDYTVQLDITFSNAGTKALQESSYFVAVGGSSPIHVTDLPYNTRFDWYHGGSTGVADPSWFAPGTIPLIGIQTRQGRDLYFEEKPDVTWAAVASQYFCTILTTQTEKGISAWAKRFDTHRVNNDRPVYGMQGALGMPGFTVTPGASVTKSFIIYAGPKEVSHLDRMGGGQAVLMNYGWAGFVSQFLLWALTSLNGIFHSYAAAIIVLTLIIKTCLWPVQNKATREMRKMAALSPKMTEMREKYKDDPQKLNDETMKLYREYGVNPFSGCLPMVIQIPIFFGFYSMLGTAIVLRNSQFLWVKDLSQPDTAFHIMGFPVNILPLIMAGSMLWQMSISPKSGDAVQQRMFYFMPVIFLVFCYNYASALALYWTTQNLFSIVQLYLTRNRPLPTLEKKSVVAKREAALQKKQKKRRP